jgi:hypothetical protein
VIINYPELRNSRGVWRNNGGSLAHFDAAASILNAATCHADVHRGLTNSPYRLVSPNTGAEWQVSYGGLLMLKYKLDEDLAAGTANVEIVP